MALQLHAILLKYSVQFKRIQGEAGNIDIGALNQWQQEVLHIILASFSFDDVFNADETELFWQLLPNKTLSFKGKFFMGF
jgi:hypothetical protein